MEREIKKWDIVKIKEPKSDNLPEGISFKKTKYGWDIKTPKTKTIWGSGRYLEFNIPSNLVGLSVVVISFYTGSEYQVCALQGVETKVNNLLTLIGLSKVFIPSTFLEPTGRRLLDSRLLSFTQRNYYATEVRNKSHYGNISSRTKLNSVNTTKDLLEIRKRQQIFFQPKKMTIKDAMSNMFLYINYSGNNGYNSIWCAHCEYPVSIFSMASNRYFRKDGSITYKCPNCKKVNFISLSYHGNTEEPYVCLTRKKQ